MPRNPIIADGAFKGGYIDAWGRGTVRVIEACANGGLPEPEIIEKDGGISLTMFQQFSDEHIAKMGLNERQIMAIAYIKENESITNKEYLTLFDVTDRTALRDLQRLISHGIIISHGTQKGTFYTLKSDSKMSDKPV